ncbi:MAG: MFS transporter [Hespellia sp.]|nr:MFS transporter [Hespellia sp.]
MEKKKFSGWGVFLGCFLISVFITGNLSNSLSLYMNPICKGLNIEASAYSLTTLVGTLVMAISAMVWGPKMQKGNMKVMMLISVILCGIGFIIYSMSTNLVMLLAAAAVTNIGMAGATQMPIALLITLWFNKSRSTVMSIAYAGGGIGGAVFAQVVGRLLESVGWSKTMFMMGVVAAGVGAFVCIFLIKKSPADCDQEAYEGKPGESEKEMSEAKKAKMAENAELAAWEGVEKKVATKSASFWLLALCMFCIGLMAAGVSTHVPNYLMSECGWSSTAAANVVTVFSLVAVVGTILGGVLFDNIGPKGGVLFATVSACIGLVLLLMAGTTPALAYLFAALFGLAQVLPKMVPAILVSRCFGVKGYAAVFSLINLVFLIGCAIGSVVTGVIAGAASYKTAWIMYAVITVIIFITTSLSITNSKKLREQYPNEK